MRGPDPRHLPRDHRPRRGPGALQRHRAQARNSPARVGAGAHARRGDRPRETDGLSAHRPPLLRPRRARHGGRARRGDAARVMRRRRSRSRRSGRSTSTASWWTRSRPRPTRSATASTRFVPAVMEHIELAGVHSGDSGLHHPAGEHCARARRDHRGIHAAPRFSSSGVVGLINVQYAIAAGRCGSSRRIRARAGPCPS